MKTILITQATVADGRDVFSGESHDVEDKTARDLVAIGFARYETDEPVEPAANPLYVKSNGNGTFEKSAKPKNAKAPKNDV